MLPGIGDHGNGFSIIAGHDPEQRRMPFGMKRDTFADLEIQHMRVRAHLAQKTQTLHNPVVQIDELRLAEPVNMIFILVSNFPRSD